MPTAKGWRPQGRRYRSWTGRPTSRTQPLSSPAERAYMGGGRAQEEVQSRSGERYRGVGAEKPVRSEAGGVEVTVMSPRVWHGSATSQESVDLAARYGDPLFSANVTHPIEPYAELMRYYRGRWEHYGHDPARAVVGAGTAGYYAARTSQEALAAYRPVFEGRLAFQKRLGVEPVFATLEDFVERSSALIGSPQQVIDKVHRYHEQFGHSVLHLHADAGGLTHAQHRASLELFQSDIAPVLRRDIPDPPFPWAPVLAAPEPEPVSPSASASAPTDR
ncbi:LLM class flavin-dependent oxidoreductase [Streptomyces sp. NPDC057445]|uniref:LLM class flavin-dependent oxidoreductase n=1 Tax=Streptomyces sp. NPDC057445 TaxID=3346136 RepID=UPI0036AF9A7C